jgi:hypothetical protein
VNSHGDLVEEIVRNAKHEVLLVAPFIKQMVLRRLLGSISSSVPVVVCTRWRPDEIAAGVSDLGVFDEIADRPQSSLRLCANLHAKYYRADNRVLLGSANLTSTGLGWAANANLEILVPLSDGERLATFEDALMAASFQATRTIRMLMAEMVAEIRSLPPPVLQDDHHAAQTVQDKWWFPRTRNPELVFRAYCGSSELSSVATQQTRADLAVMELRPGQSEAYFRSMVRAALLQSPTVAALDQLLAEPRRFGEVQSFMREQLLDAGSTREPDEASQTLLRWLIHFLPERYRGHTARYSEVFSRLGDAE